MKRAVGVIALALVVAAAAPGRAVVRSVAPDGRGPYATIQAALDAAGDGDVIELADGIYAGDGNRDLDLRGKAVTVRSRAGDPERCVIDCAADGWAAQHRGFVCTGGEGPASRIEGLTVRHGQAVADRPPAGAGGAVLCRDASPSFRDCVFTANRATTGGAVASLGTAGPTFTRCVFRANTATYGGAVQAFQASLSLEDCLLYDNTAAHGGAVALFGGQGRLRRCRLERNSATTGGALACEQGTVLTVEESFLARNQATLGGALFSATAPARLRRCTLAGNGAGSGAGVCARGGARIDLEGCVLACSTQGEAAFADEQSVVGAACCLVWGNGDGDWVAALAGQAERAGNRRDDPGFADPERGDFRLRPDAPARASAGPCGPPGAPASLTPEE